MGRARPSLWLDAISKRGDVQKFDVHCTIGEMIIVQVAENVKVNKAAGRNPSFWSEVDLGPLEIKVRTAAISVYHPDSSN
jgi:hypothetical protein